MCILLLPGFGKVFSQNSHARVSFLWTSAKWAFKSFSGLTSDVFEDCIAVFLSNSIGLVLTTGSHNASVLKSSSHINKVFRRFLIIPIFWPVPTQFLQRKEKTKQNKNKNMYIYHLLLSNVFLLLQMCSGIVQSWPNLWIFNQVRSSKDELLRRWLW